MTTGCIEEYKGWKIFPLDDIKGFEAFGPGYDAECFTDTGWQSNGEQVEARTIKDLYVEIEDNEAARAAETPAGKMGGQHD